MTKSKKIFVSIACLALLGFSFLTGSFIGFSNGYAFSVYHASVMDSYYIMRALELLKSSDIKGAENKLESQLDTKLVEHWTGLANKPLRFSFEPIDNDAISQIMSKVATYRRNNPQKSDDAEVEEAIQTVVNRYAK